MARVGQRSTIVKRRAARSGKKTTIYLSEADRSHISAILKAGWATSATGVIRFALKVTAKMGST